MIDILKEEEAERRSENGVLQSGFFETSLATGNWPISVDDPVQADEWLNRMTSFIAKSHLLKYILCISYLDQLENLD